VGAAILGAEYLLRLLPRGTHHYAQFLKPSEIAQDLRASGLMLEDLAGIGYNPLTRKAWLTPSVAVNYLACAWKPA
jgi:2-polyprenyl-6-hydroxyphenyl methylase/3-demethylubiquinone-9 3-methyltransferase